MPSIEPRSPVCSVLFTHDRLMKRLMRGMFQFDRQRKTLSDPRIGNQAIPNQLDLRLRRERLEIGMENGRGLALDGRSMAVRRRRGIKRPRKFVLTYSREKDGGPRGGG